MSLRSSMLLALLAGNLACAEYFFYDEDYGFDASRRRIDRDTLVSVRISVVESVLPEDAVFPPPELPRASALPMETVSLEPLFVTSTGPVPPEQVDARFAPVWWACIWDGNERETPEAEDLVQSWERGCLPTYYGMDAEQVRPCSQAHPVLPLLDPNGLARRRVTGPCVIGGEGQPRYTLPWSYDAFSVWGGGVEIRMAAHRSGRPSASQECARALLEQRELDASCMLARTKLIVGPRDRLAHIPGTQVSDHIPEVDELSGEDAGLPADGIEDALPEPASRHFRPIGFRLRVYGTDGIAREWISVPHGGRIDLARGERMVVYPQADLASLQTEANGAFWPGSGGGGPEDDHEGELDDEPPLELISSFWYHTWGTVTSARALYQPPPFGPGAETEPVEDDGWRELLGPQEVFEPTEADPTLSTAPLLWRADQKRGIPDDGVVWLYAVSTDSGGGLGWSWLSVQVRL